MKKISGVKNTPERNSNNIMGILRQIADLQNKSRINKMNGETKSLSSIPVKSWNS